MTKWERFKKWDERTERDHPKAYALINIVTGIAFFTWVAVLAMILWAVTK